MPDAGRLGASTQSWWRRLTSRRRDWWLSEPLTWSQMALRIAVLVAAGAVATLLDAALGGWATINWPVTLVVVLVFLVPLLARRSRA